MKKTEVDEETNCSIIIPYTNDLNFIEIDESLPTLDVKYTSNHAIPAKSNISGGMAAWCMDAIVKNEDLMASREYIKHDGDVGCTVSEKLAQIKRMTAASIFLNGENRLGKGILENVEALYNIVMNKQKKRQTKKELTWRNMTLSVMKFCV